MDRTIILKASGYYDIHMSSLDEPRTETLSKILLEPGCAVKYAWGEYLKWQREIQAETSH